MDKEEKWFIRGAVALASVVSDMGVSFFMEEALSRMGIREDEARMAEVEDEEIEKIWRA